MKVAAEQLAQAAVTPFLKAAFRRRILEIRQQNEQTIDRHTIDDVLYSGFDASAVEKAQAKVKDFRAWIERPQERADRASGDLRRHAPAEAVAQGPAATARRACPPAACRHAHAALARLPGRGSGQGEGHRGRAYLTDLVNLVRHALIPALTLVPYREELRERYQAWLKERNADKTFTPEQREWLDRMAEHIATSLAIEPDDFESGWFGQHGSLGRAHALFGDKLRPLLAELNERLAA